MKGFFDLTMVIRLRLNAKLSKDTLSEGRIAYAEECMKKLGKTVANDEADSEARAYEVESWTGSTQGKKIEGKFVSLDGSDLTLEKSNGKAMTFDVKFLSAESRERAEKYAAKAKP